MARHLLVLVALFLLQPACTTDFHGDEDGDTDADDDLTEADGTDVDAEAPDTPDAPDDGDEPDGPTGCENDGDCRDDDDCNGQETCDLDSGECRPGEPEPNGFICGLDPRSICLDGTCAASFCGDGFVDTGAGEFCDPPGEGACLDGCELGCERDDDCSDDGNVCNGEEVCDMTTHTCDRTSPPAEGTPCGTDPRSICLAGSCQESTCGDGFVDEGADPAEECDDNNTTPGDGCDNDCTLSCHNNDECQDGVICNGEERCNASHFCEPGSNAPSGAACDDDGIDCTNDVCNGTGDCEHRIVTDTCLIEGVCYPNNEPRPGNPCWTCRIDVSQTAWTPLADTTPCTDDGNVCTNDMCMGGTCTHPNIGVLRGVKQVAVGNIHVCALMSDNMRIKCWGAGWAGQLGTGAATGSYTPASVDRSPFGTHQVQMIASGNYHSCALLDDGTMWCWGSNNDGELGNGTTSSVNPTAGQVSGLVSVAHIGLGWDHSCAVTDPGRVYCWGSRTSGQCGVESGASDSDILTPEVVWDALTSSAMTGGMTVDGGGIHTCAMAESDRIRCWGHNSSGQLGDGSVTRRVNPVYVIEPSSYFPHENFAAVSTGASHTCGLNTGAGLLECWGLNSSGQIGDGTTTQRNAPRAVKNPDTTNLVGVTMVTAGYYHTCAVVSGGLAKCWGSNSNGQLGLGVGSTGETFATTVLLNDSGTNLTNVQEINAGSNITCAIVGPERDLFCWGSDSDGQLGNGWPTEDQFYPVPVSCMP